MRIGLVLLSYLASANCLPNAETFARKAESYLGKCLVLSVNKNLIITQVRKLTSKLKVPSLCFAPVYLVLWETQPWPRVQKILQ
jgi:hypothetical protein